MCHSLDKPSLCLSLFSREDQREESSRPELGFLLTRVGHLLYHRPLPPLPNTAGFFTPSSRNNPFNRRFNGTSAPLSRSSLPGNFLHSVQTGFICCGLITLQEYEDGHTFSDNSHDHSHAWRADRTGLSFSSLSLCPRTASCALPCRLKDIRRKHDTERHVRERKPRLHTRVLSSRLVLPFKQKSRLTSIHRGRFVGYQWRLILLREARGRLKEFLPGTVSRLECPYVFLPWPLEKETCLLYSMLRASFFSSRQRAKRILTCPFLLPVMAPASS